jgi:hypothetical protein
MNAKQFNQLTNGWMFTVRGIVVTYEINMLRASTSDSSKATHKLKVTSSFAFFMDIVNMLESANFDQ